MDIMGSEQSADSLLADTAFSLYFCNLTIIQVTRLSASRLYNGHIQPIYKHTSAIFHSARNAVILEPPMVSHIALDIRPSVSSVSQLISQWSAPVY